MKTLVTLFLTAVLATYGINSLAQSSSTTDPSQQLAAKKTQQIQDKVTGVSQDQLTKILVAEQEWAKARQTAKSNGASDATVKSQLKTLREDRDAKIKGILTADQYAQYQSMEKWDHTGYKQNENNK